jgi:hypothetical protein
MMPIRYRRAQLARQLKQFHAQHPEFIRERLRAFDEHNGRDKMIPLTQQKLKRSPYAHRSATMPRERAPITSG